MLLRERVYKETGKRFATLRHKLCKTFISENTKKRIYKRYNKVCAKYSYKTDQVALLAGSVYNKAYYWNLKDIEKTVWVPFEDIEIPIPQGYQHCLEVQYGDYMTLPPVEKRGAHHLEVVIFDPFVDYKTYMKTHRPDGTEIAKGNT